MNDTHLDLSRRERQIMDVLYRHPKATAAEVLAALPEPPGYSAVRAMLAKLERKGHVIHEREGQRYLYSPTVPAAKARDSAIFRLVDTFFAGSMAQAASKLLGQSVDQMTDEDLDKLSDLIDEARTQEEPPQ